MRLENLQFVYGTGKIKYIRQDRNGSAQNVADHDTDHQWLHFLVKSYAAYPDQNGFNSQVRKTGKKALRAGPPAATTKPMGDMGHQLKK